MGSHLFVSFDECVLFLPEINGAGYVNWLGGFLGLQEFLILLVHYWSVCVALSTPILVMRPKKAVVVFSAMGCTITIPKIEFEFNRSEIQNGTASGPKKCY